MTENDDFDGDYYFPDQDEGDQLLGDDMIDITGKEVDGSYTIGLIAAGLFTLCAAICVIIGWILYDVNKGSFLLSFAIIATLAFLAGLFFTFVFFKNQKAMKSGANRSYNLDVLVWVLGLSFIGYFLVTGLMVFLFRPFHFNKMNESFLDRQKWDDRWGGDFGSEWASDDRLLITLGIFCLLAGFFAIIFVSNIYSNYPVKYSLEVTMLYLALLFAFIFAIVAI